MKRFSAVLISLFVLAGCQTAYYGAMEKFGVHKREILVDRITDTQKAQEETQETFKTALEKLIELTDFKGGELLEVYEQMKGELDTSQTKADQLTKHVDNVEHVATALFDEWRDEIQHYSSSSLKQKSEQKLKSTERQFQRMLKSMRRAESKMEPILRTLNDQVLYLKHNLNAAAISDIKLEFDNVKDDIRRLIDDMNKSISTAREFVAGLEG